MQCYNSTKLQFIYTSKGAVHRKCVITNKYGKQCSAPARPPKVIQKAIFNNIQSESCDEVEIAA